MLSKSFRTVATNSKILTIFRFKYRTSSCLAIALLSLSGYAGNYFNLPLFFGVDFLFGSIAVLLIACLYGIGWGTIAATIAGSYTFFLWGHPYAALILTLEGFFVGWGVRCQRKNLLLLDAFYWVLIGMPLVWLFYAIVLEVPAQTVVLIMLKQSVNGIFNALIASLILTYSPIQNWLTRAKAVKALSLHQTLFNLLVACALFPALTLMVLYSQSAVSNIETTIQTNLQHESTDVVVTLRLWYQQRLDALGQLAQIAASSDMSPSTALQQSTELLQRTHPMFHQLSVVNQAGVAIASYPAEDSGTHLKELGLKQDGMRADVVMAGDGSSSPLLIQRLPVRRNDQVLGSIVTQSDLSAIAQLLQSLISDRELEVTLLDRQERAIASTRPDLPLLQTYNYRHKGEIRFLNAEVYQWLPVAQKMPSMVRWKNSFYARKTPASNTLPWTVIVEAATKPHFSYLQNLYIKSLGSMLLIAVLVLLLAHTISRWLATPIWQLAQVTTDLPYKLLDRKTIVWPSAWIVEMNALVDNFQCMAGTLEQKFQEIRSAKEQLEQRVQERTRELSAKNQELAAEVTERQRVADALQESETLLRAQTKKLKNTLRKLQRTQAQLVQTEKMSSLGQLVAGVAHEINNPVSFIYGNIIHARDYTQDLIRLIQLYQQHYPNSVPAIQAEIEATELEFVIEDMPKLLDSMQAGAKRIHQIVESLRNFSRLDESDMKEVDIHEGIESTLMLLQNRLKAPPFAQGVKYPAMTVIKEYGQLPVVECYPGQLNQVFMNILVNAIDAIDEQFSHKDGETLSSLPSSPWIRIRTEQIEADWLAIRIANNGTGITEEHSSKLFDPFFTTKPIGQGTGLGLSIAYQIIVKKHGGKLYCIAGQKQGAEFVIELPIQQPMH
ncbi:MAG TPA: ATP-binding protein [Chroococcales cyanobacterium]